MRTDALEIIHADSDYGELILVENNTAGHWSVLYGERGIYFPLEADGQYCIRYDESDLNCRYEDYFRPTVLKIRHSSQEKFPVGLFQQRVFGKVQRFQIANIGFREFIATNCLVPMH